MDNHDHNECARRTDRYLRHLAAEYEAEQDRELEPMHPNQAPAVRSVGDGLDGGGRPPRSDHDRISSGATLELTFQGTTDHLPLQDWTPGAPVPDKWFKSVHIELPEKSENYVLDEERLIAHFVGLTANINWENAPPGSSVVELAPPEVRGLLRYYWYLGRDFADNS